MDRNLFKLMFAAVMEDKGSRMSESQIKDRIATHSRGDKDIPVIIGELAELSLELTRYQRGKMDPNDLLQELSHVQWAVWTLQSQFGISDEELHAAVQASFR